MSGQLRIIPLGGLGEVGMNCLALEQSDGILVVDCGVTFPDDDRGIEVLHPNFQYLIENRQRVCGVFLTHGHEDHVGALPYLLSELKVPVWGPPHALKLGLRRVRERVGQGKAVDYDFRPATPGKVYPVGPFRIEPVRVSHSIIEATALCIETQAGFVVHSGDFKFDGNPPDGEHTDSARLHAIGERGVALLLSDSTNIDSAGESGSESAVAEALLELTASAKHRMVVGMFSSNVQRLISIGRVAEKTGRRIGLLGRSLSTHVDAAHELGHLAWPESVRINSDQLGQCARGDLLLLAGGSQGEAGSALWRLAHAEHPALALDAGDRVVLSCRVIPGNERRVIALTGQLLRRNLDLRTRLDEPEVHVSGHAARPELERMIALLRPRTFIPVHGTLHHLRRHAALAQQLGVEQCAVIENGTTARLDARGLCLDAVVPTGRVAVDRQHRPLSRQVLRERSLLGREGVVHVAWVLDQNEVPQLPPRIAVIGVAALEGERTLRELGQELERTLRRRARHWQQLGLTPESELARHLEQHLEYRHGIRPHTRVDLIRL